MSLAEVLSHYLGGIAFTQVLLEMALVMGRVLPLTLIAPFLGGELVQSEVKIGVGITLGMILFPLVGSGVPVPPMAFPFITLLLKEVAIGGAVAFISSLVFEACRAAGTLVDTMSGSNLATALVPQIQQQASLFADLQFQLAVVMFLTLNGHHVVITALADSFRVVPINAYPQLSQGGWPLVQMLLTSTAQLMLMAVALAAPPALAIFLADVTFGLINRVAPQIQVFFLSMSVKPVIAVFITLTSLTVAMDVMGQDFGRLVADVDQAVGLLR
jgi:flagellar biosynthetic protein FliR